MDPAATQVPETVIEAVSTYYRESNANAGGAFATSERNDAISHEAHLAMADLLGAADPESIKFGANMTTLTLHLSRSIGATLSPGDEIVVTSLDHQANVDPWLLLAKDRGLTVRTVDIRPDDASLDLTSLDDALGPKTKLVAFGWASNAVGTITRAADIVFRAHKVGALAYVDAVHFAPHAAMDVHTLDADFVVCSAYKFFGPHAGCCTASGTCWIRCRRTRSVLRTTGSRPGRRTSKGWPACWLRSSTSRGWGERRALPRRSPAGG